MTQGVFIIAEAGVNHNADPELAFLLVEEAFKSGVDAVKFQTFKGSEMVSRGTPKADYQQNTTDSHESHFEMIQKLELDWPTHIRLAERCKQLGVQFLSSPFDLTSLDFLVKDMGLSTLKIGSGEMTNAPLLLRASLSGRRVILSTGMATLKEVEQALMVLAFGYTKRMVWPTLEPSLDNFRRSYNTDEGKSLLKERVILLHCTTEYPAPFQDINLRAMESLKTAFGLPVGFSDHSLGITMPIAAVARGAVVIEKHLTLDNTLPGPDHQASLEPSQLTEMVKAIRCVEMALGDGQKIAAPSELKNRWVARKSLVALTPLLKGEIFTESNLGVKRPGGGISPMFYWQWLGNRATRDYGADELIEDELIE